MENLGNHIATFSKTTVWRNPSLCVRVVLCSLKALDHSCLRHSFLCLLHSYTDLWQDKGRCCPQRGGWGKTQGRESQQETARTGKVGPAMRDKNAPSTPVCQAMDGPGWRYKRLGTGSLSWLLRKRGNSFSSVSGTCPSLRSTIPAARELLFALPAQMSLTGKVRANLEMDAELKSNPIDS